MAHSLLLSAAVTMGNEVNNEDNNKPNSTRSACGTKAPPVPALRKAFSVLGSWEPSVLEVLEGSLPCDCPGPPKVLLGQLWLRKAERFRSGSRDGDHQWWTDTQRRVNRGELIGLAPTRCEAGLKWSGRVPANQEPSCRLLPTLGPILFPKACRSHSFPIGCRGRSPRKAGCRGLL